MSRLSESNQRPTDYKSVALPAELKRRINLFKELPLVFGKAKVKEFELHKQTGIKLFLALLFFILGQKKSRRSPAG